MSLATPFPQLCRKSDETVRDMFWKGRLRRGIDDATASAVKKKKATTQMANDIFEESSLLKPLSLFTHKQVRSVLRILNWQKNLNRVRVR